MKFSKRIGFGVVLLLLASGALLAQNIPLNNWTVPPYTQSSRGGITTMTDITPPRAFIGIQPCRVADTRGFGAPIQGGIFANSEARNWTVWGICGIPTGADAISVNFTVVAAGGIPAGSFLLAWPTGQPPPPTAVMTYGPGQILSNAAIVPLNGSGQLTVNVSGSTHIIMDVNGYFSDTLGNPGNIFQIINNSGSQSIFTENDSTTCGANCGITAAIASTNGAWAITGFANGTTGVNYGVYGTTFSSTTGTAGVYGTAGTSGQTYGVHGHVTSSNSEAAGVNGDATGALANGGRFVNSGAGNVTAFAATQVSSVNYGFYTLGRILGGSLDIIGLPKNFVSPHPEDPSKEIKYASVEAPTVDVYFRGTASLVNGLARIEVPDHFRFTAREGTYMTTLTPVGTAVALSVASEGPNGIVVRGAGNASFHYVVYAERAEIEGFEPVQPNTVFTPEALEKLGGPEQLPAPTRALLVKNGTLNPDGTYNMETARAHGWTIPERQTSPPARQEP